MSVMEYIMASLARSDARSECATIMEIRESEEDMGYECSSDVDKNLDELTMTVARRMSISQIIARKSLSWARSSIAKLPIKLTLGNFGFLTIFLTILMPRAITYILVYPTFRLVFGTLYPAYASYKAVRTKNVKEYVKWMMYWIVFALFTCAETFTDIFLSFWFPFYYETKVILVVWLLSPATKGSSILYRRFVHPALSSREAEIDEALARATEQGYTAVLHLGSRGVNYATTVLMQTAIKGGGGLVQQLKKSYSLSDLTGEKEDENRNMSSMHDETDMEVEPRRREHPGRRGYSPRRTQSSSNRVEMYFSEVDVDVRQPRPRDPIASLTNIRSSDDISSGYSSGEALQSHRITSQGESLLRTSSVGARARARPRSTTKKVPEDEEDDYMCELTSSDRAQIPSPLSLLSTQQALELILLLSQIDPSKNSAILARTDNILKGEADGARSEADKTATNKMQAGNFNSQINATTIEEIVEIPTVNSCHNNYEERFEATEASVSEEDHVLSPEVSHVEQVDSEIDIRKVTDEICQDKLDELKVLLSNAHKAVTNIVSSHEKLHTVGQVEPVTNESEIYFPVQDECHDPETSRSNSVEVWTTPTSSRSNSESDGRAGRYNKKPAPKVPLSKSEDDCEDTALQNALKATLVIKTGTLKTFTNVSQTKNVFVSHLSDSSKLKKKKSRRKDGFSRLLTIPKTFFNHAFHKESKNASGTDDDSNSIISDAGTSRSRSLSIGSRGDAKDTDSVVLKKKSVDDVLLNVALADDNCKTDTYVDLRTDSLDRCVFNDEARVSDQLDPMLEKSEKELPGAESMEMKGDARPSLKIRQMSHSPTRGSTIIFHECE